jgi:hypothetical protein
MTSTAHVDPQGLIPPRAAAPLDTQQGGGRAARPASDGGSETTSAVHNAFSAAALRARIDAIAERDEAAGRAAADIYLDACIVVQEAAESQGAEALAVLLDATPHVVRGMPAERVVQKLMARALPRSRASVSKCSLVVVTAIDEQRPVADLIHQYGGVFAAYKRITEAHAAASDPARAVRLLRADPSAANALTAPGTYSVTVVAGARGTPMLTEAIPITAKRPRKGTKPTEPVPAVADGTQGEGREVAPASPENEHSTGAVRAEQCGAQAGTPASMIGCVFRVLAREHPDLDRHLRAHGRWVRAGQAKRTVWVGEDFPGLDDILVRLAGHRLGEHDLRGMGVDLGA